MIMVGVSGGRCKKKSGYSQGSNCRLAEADHDFPLET